MSDFLDELNSVEIDTQKDKYLVFSLGKEDYAIEIKHVMEIIGIQTITDIPEMPHYVKGIINLRGKIIPVIDVRLRFKKEWKEYHDRTCIIVVEVKEMSIGLIVDSVSEVISIGENNISLPPQIKKDGSNRFIKGVAKVNEQVKLIINCEELLSDDYLNTINEI